jgi:hypothetical protein
MLESGTSGSVGGEEGNLLAYPAAPGVWLAPSGPGEFHPEALT